MSANSASCGRVQERAERPTQVSLSTMDPEEPCWPLGDPEIARSALATGLRHHRQLDAACTVCDAFGAPPRYRLLVPVTDLKWTACTGEANQGGWQCAR